MALRVAEHGEFLRIKRNGLGTLTLARTALQESITHILRFPCGNRLPGFVFPSVNEHGDMGVLELSLPCSSGGGGGRSLCSLLCPACL